MTKLNALNNYFEEANWVQCFNHTLQLSAKTLLAPFNTAISGNVTHNDKVSEKDSNNELLPEVGQDDGDSDGDNDDDDDDDEEEEEEEEEECNDGDDGIDELQELSPNEWVWIMESTTVVCVTVTKV